MAERSFAREVQRLRPGPGQEFRGEGILAITKALLERGVGCSPRRVRTDAVLGFLTLHIVAGLSGWRWRTLRHRREMARVADWLASVRAIAAEGLDKFARVMAAAARLRGRPNAAAWMRRLRDAALKDEQGVALDGALRTVDSFLDERAAA